jgi:hypothetical protein
MPMIDHCRVNLFQTFYLSRSHGYMQDAAGSYQIKVKIQI